MVDLKKIGKTCQAFRRSQGVSQTAAAVELHYSIENISAFECGRNANVKIFLWYIQHGMTIDYLREGGVFE